MKIERDGVALQSQLKRNNLDSLEQILHDSQKSTTKMREISREWQDNGYSSIPRKELNNNIGILQIAKKTLQNILSNSHITLDGVFR